MWIIVFLSNYIIFTSYQFSLFFALNLRLVFLKEPNNKLIFMQLTSFHNFIVLLLFYLYCVQFQRIYIVFQLKVSRLENSTKKFVCTILQHQNFQIVFFIFLYNSFANNLTSLNVNILPNHLAFPIIYRQCV